MNPIEDLKNEHEAVRLTLKILDRITAGMAGEGTQRHPEHLDQLFEFFGVFVDQCHHGKEEALLFPALEAVGVGNNGGPIGVMLREHDQGRDLVAKMKRALADYRAGDTSAAGRLRKHAEAYIDLLTQHIEKENRVLFPLAAQHLSAGALADMMTGFDDIETRRIGPGRHAAFHRMLDDLAAANLEAA
jgi:hemerythrin-like domain-containing protein